MTPAQLKQLRSELRCTARELAATLGLEPSEIQAWEGAERFPTKQIVAKLEALRAKGPSSILRKSPKSPSSEPEAANRLSDPAFWTIVRKLALHQKFFVEASKLAEQYPESAE